MCRELEVLQDSVCDCFIILKDCYLTDSQRKAIKQYIKETQEEIRLIRLKQARIRSLETHLSNYLKN